MKRKALVVDIDGTLTDSRKEISRATREAVLAALERGHICVLASGRPTVGMARYARELELEERGGYLLSYNGACILSCRGGETLYRRTLPLSVVPKLYAFAEEHACGLVTHRKGEAISAFEPDRYVELEAHINGMSVRRVPDFVSFVDFDVYKCFLTAEGERAAGLEGSLREICRGEAEVYRSEPYFIEVVPEGVDKGDSLRRLMEHLGIPREDVVCCGDGFNDIPMLRYAGTGVAMGNAQQAVKDAADYVAAGNDEDGVAEAVHRFLLAEGA